MAPSVLVVAGPSGVGKGTILQLLREHFRDNIVYSISHTTRQPRKGEENGREYYFVSNEEFEEMLRNGQFIEHNHFNNKYYGTSIDEITRIRKMENRLCLLEIDVNGVKQLQDNPALKDSTLYVFIYPPSMEELEKRIRQRGTETEESLQKRLSIAKTELTAMDNLHKDLQICNDKLEQAVDELKMFVQDHYAI
eukprot:Blabericola_migrator_1__1595@NODE_1424_length_4568_cov_180_439014_g947_i0_p3_GENE_NODE_1424_length_4568_cov_180_439014_g947_i0NODE_1424_length_4568_cov_180_439014_g947_i0_p3_ORF_typecomplete_len194_score39_55Guanylate_kin/PF00625_21/1_1e59AAA_18/PF13238_6/6_6e07AAA_18/PF13238_6/1_9e03PRK/PF00485_18/1_8e06dNK/PF01712_19/1_9e05CPT/PF07931_12/1_1e05ADK/PF00406_22/6_2e05Rad17/PF03215_15/4_7e05AAA_14/PF13173_6/0_00023AAA_14/PF13173_6/1e03AAA_15/PF13175_6/0_00015Zeta_toxin/PF06414_12/0_00088Zeta_toxin